MFIVLEIQTAADGSVTVLEPAIRSSRAEAESLYHSVLSFAALSPLPMHAAVLLTGEGIVLERKAYTRETAEAK